MKKIIQWIKCKFDNHEYYTHEQLSEFSYRVKCKKCNGDWVANRNMMVAFEWNDEVAEFYKTLKEWED